MNSSNATNATGPTLHRFHISNTIGVVECTIGMLVNSCLLLVIYVDPLRKLRKFNWLSISNMAIADFLSSACSVVLSTMQVVENNMVFFLANVFFYVGYSSSFFLLLLFAVERYIAIKYPLHTRTILTRRRAIIGCLICWTAAALVGVALIIANELPFVPAYSIMIGMFVILEMTTVLLIAFKIMILCRIRESFRIPVDMLCDGTHQKSKQRREITITLVVLIVVLLFTAFPYSIAKQLELCRRINPTAFEGTIVRDFSYYFFPVACINFIVNPFIYAWRLKDYRDSFLALFQQKLTQSRKRFSAYQAANMETITRQSSC